MIADQNETLTSPEVLAVATVFQETELEARGRTETFAPRGQSLQLATVALATINHLLEMIPGAARPLVLPILRKKMPAFLSTLTPQTVSRADAEIDALIDAIAGRDWIVVQEVCTRYNIRPESLEGRVILRLMGVK